MTPGDRAAALAALNAARPIYARLNQVGSAEDVAADIIDLWEAAGEAMRALLGGSSLSGQALVRELRQRNGLSHQEANAVVSFLDARSRMDDPKYRPTGDDIAVSRAGFDQLEQAIQATGRPAQPVAAPAWSGAVAPPPAPPFAPHVATGGAAPGAAMHHMYATPAAAGDAHVSSIGSPARRFSPLGWVGLALAVLAAILLAAFALTRVTGRDGASLTTGISLMQSGRREAARADFQRVASDNPNDARPHIFLARLAREERDNNTARRELEIAIRLDPRSTQAMREMGLLLLSEGNYELARRFFVRAITTTPSDTASQGYLGCALLRLGRIEEGRRFMARAGSGSWSTCTAVVTPGAQMPAVPQ